MLTTVNAAVQRVPARDVVAAQALSVAPGNVVPMDSVIAWLEHNGYSRASTVREAGEYAVRGGILDLFPAGLDLPVRFDYFGDALELIRSFDSETQRTHMTMRGLDLVPISEFQLVTETIKRFRMGYVAEFGAPSPDDALYEAVSEGRRYPGMEHWLPLFQQQMDTLFDYLDDVPIALEPQVEDAARERFKQIHDYYDARKEALGMTGGGTVYKPLPPDRLYLTEEEWQSTLRGAALARLTPFAVPDESENVVDIDARQGRNFAPERADSSINVFANVVDHIHALQAARKKVVVALWSEGSRDRMTSMLRDHKLVHLTPVNAWRTVQATPRNETMLAVVGMESGFETNEVAVITEQDILGDRLVRRAQIQPQARQLHLGGDEPLGRRHRGPRRARHRPLRRSAESEVGGAPHDCLELHYANDTKLYLPVENIELLSRYGSEGTNVELDKLGGSGWQNRKAKLKNRIREIAGELIKIAAERLLRDAPKLPVQQGPYDEFCARFPYDETEDQLTAINAALDDLEAGKPMDRLVCGDVGFGKTEVALRAAFAVALDGKQVAVVVPTTLLARQHAKTFTDRFKGFPVKVAQTVAAGHGQGAARDQDGSCRWFDRHRCRHPRRARQDREISRSRPDRGRRGTAFRRLAQREAQAIARGSPCADAVGDADPAHAATGAHRCPRSVDHRIRAGRSPRGADLCRAARPGDDPRGAAARTLSRRSVVLCLPADRGSRGGEGISRQACAGDEGRGRAWPDAADGDRRHHGGVLRRQVRHPAVDHHCRVRVSIFLRRTR